MSDQCICAAIKLPNGEVWRGHRHDDAIKCAGKAGATREDIANAAQGFITSQNRFVSREEGARIQQAAGIVSAQSGQLPAEMLFSEDLYLRSWRDPLPGAAAPPAEATDDTPPPLWRHAVTECNEAHAALDRYAVPLTKRVRRVRGPDGDQDVTIGLAARIHAMAAELKARAASSAPAAASAWQPINTSGGFNALCAVLAAAKDLPYPEIVLEDDGDVALDWSGARDCDLTVSIRADGSIAWSAHIGSWHDYQNARPAVSEELRDAMTRFKVADTQSQPSGVVPPEAQHEREKP